MKNFVMEKISREADELARQYNRTKDSGLRDQWYELIKKVSQVSVEEPLDYSRKRNRT